MDAPEGSRAHPLTCRAPLGDGVLPVHATRHYYEVMKNLPGKISAMPKAEVAINLELVRELIATQATSWAQKRISYLATGWDNEIYRLGTQLLIRLPRRQMGEKLGILQRRWLPSLVETTGLEIGLALFVGKPTAEYPFTFSIHPMVPGSCATTIERLQRDEYAQEFAALLTRLHRRADPSAPRSKFRGLPLQGIDANTRELIAALGEDRRDKAVMLWEDALEAEAYTEDLVWLHGDPHPQNTILTEGGLSNRRVALVDFDDLCAGDPASDLGMFWMHFSTAGVARAMCHYGVSPGSALWRRARGWALRFAMLTAALPEEEALGRVGQETLQILFTEAV